MAYSLSASAAKISSTFFHTPLLAQRENRVCVLIGSPKRSGRSRLTLDPAYRSRRPRRRAFNQSLQHAEMLYHLALDVFRHRHKLCSEMQDIIRQVLDVVEIVPGHSSR